MRLRYRPPYDWRSILAFLQARAIPEVEVVENEHYFRTVEMDGVSGTIEITHQPERQNICVKIRFPNIRSLPAIVAEYGVSSILVRTSRPSMRIFRTIRCWRH